MRAPSPAPSLRRIEPRDRPMSKPMKSRRRQQQPQQWEQLRKEKRQQIQQRNEQRFTEQSPLQQKPKSNRRTTLKDFRLGRLIGTGSSGTVLRALHIATNTPVAIKAIPKRTLVSSRRRLWYLRREIAIHKSLQDVQGVVKLQEVFEDADAVYMVMELLGGGDAHWNLDVTGQGVNEVAALEIVEQVLKVLVECHSRGISNRDVKLENIVFVEKPDLKNGKNIAIKVVDWGLACLRNCQSVGGKGGSSGEKVGTLRYCAPEVVRGDRYKPMECDMWSVGVVLYSLLMRECPFNGRNEHELLRNLERAKPSWDGEAGVKISSETKDIVRRLLRRDGSRRLKAQEALDMLSVLRTKLKADGINKDNGHNSIVSGCRDEVSQRNHGNVPPLDILGNAFNNFFTGFFGWNNNNRNEICA